MRLSYKIQMPITGGASKLISEAKNFACTLYKNQPGALIPNPGEQVLRLLWDTICNPPDNPQSPSLPGLPPRPAPPFVGGQCVCVKYRFNVTCAGGGLGATGQTFDIDVWGPVREILFGPVPGNAVRLTFRCGGWANQPCDSTGQTLYMIQQWGATPAPEPSYKINSVTRLDGQPDNCGSLPSNYPPAPPPPSGGYNSNNTPIVLNDNDTINVTFNLKPPVVTPPSLSIPPVVVTVKSPSFNMPISFDVDGTINIGTPGKVDVDLSPLDSVLDVLSDNVNNLTFNYNNPNYNTSTQVDIVRVPSDDKGDKDAPELLGVVIELTKMPDKAQFGEPTCYFAGWITFKNQGGYEPRYQINFLSSYFPAPVC